MKNELKATTEICAQLMLWRKVALAFAVPFACSLLLSFVGGRIAHVSSHTKWLLCLAFVAQPPMLFYLFRLADKVHGNTTAVLHVALTLILTPFFLVGPLFIPLLVLGDAQRLLLDDDSSK